MLIRKRRTLYLVVALLLAFVILPFGISVGIYETVFSRRYVPYAPLRRSLDEFEGLQAEKYTFPSDDGQLLSAYRYYRAGTVAKAVVILSHGMGGGGQNAYMDVADYFTRQSYTVFAYDATGNGQSEGSDCNGFPQGTVDLCYAIDFVEHTPDFSGLPILLFGHSWGAYSSGCALKLHPEVAAAVCIAGPDDSVSLITHYGKRYTGSAAVLLTPYLSLYEHLKFGKYASLSASEGFADSNAGIMIVHSKDDATIPDELCCDIYRSKFSDNPRFQFLEYSNRGHGTLYYSDAARAYRQSFDLELNDYLNSFPEEQQQAQKTVYLSANYQRSKAFALDTALLAQITEFYNNYIH